MTITATLTSGNNGGGPHGGPSMYISNIHYDGTNKNDKTPHKTCEITVGANRSATDPKIDGIKFFYMSDFREGQFTRLRGVRYRRTPSTTDGDNVFEAWSDRDGKAIWGMSTTRTHMTFRLDENHGFERGDKFHIVCKNGSTTIVSYNDIDIRTMHYDLPKGFSLHWVKDQLIERVLFPGVPVENQGHYMAPNADFPRGVTSQTKPGDEDFLKNHVVIFDDSRAPHVTSKLQVFHVWDANVQWSLNALRRSPIQYATESVGSGAGDHDVTNTSFSYDNDQPSDFLVGSRITEITGLNDHPRSFLEGVFTFRFPLTVRAEMERIVDMARIAKSQTVGGWTDEELTAFMVKGREYLVEIYVEDHQQPRSQNRLTLTIDRATSAGVGSSMTSGDGTDTIGSSNSSSTSAPVLPVYAEVLSNFDIHLNAQNRGDMVHIEPGQDTVRITGLHANHFRGDSLWLRFIPTQTGNYRVHLTQNLRGPGWRSYDLFVWGMSPLSAANCPGNANDHFELGIAPEKFVFDQRIEDRIFYAREVFPSDGEGIVIQPPMEARPRYILTTRREIPNSERFTADITLSLEGARFHRPMRSDGRVTITKKDGRVVEDISFMQVSGGDVGDKEVTFRFDNEFKGKLEVGTRIEFVFPALEGVNLSKERDRITVTPAEVSVLRGSYPEEQEDRDGISIGWISTCLSEVAGRGCVYARSLGTGKVDLGPVDSSGRQKGTVAIVDPNDFTRLIPGDAVVALNLPGSLTGSGVPGQVNAIRLGTVALDAGIASSAISNSCLSAYRVDSGIHPTDQIGEPLVLEYGDNLNVGLSPEPLAEDGMFLMRQLAQDGQTPIGPYQRVPAGGVFSVDISRPENRMGNWEFFFVPSGNTEMEYGNAWTLNAGIDFLYPAYSDILSEPISRSVILDHEGDLGEPQARAYAIPPLSSPDGAFVRIRCEVRGDECQISMECSNQSGQSWYGNLREYIPSGGTVVVTPPEIAQALSSTGFDPDIHWGGEVNGRLSCSFFARPDNSISMQLFVRSAGTLTNNTDVYHSQ